MINNSSATSSVTTCDRTVAWVLAETAFVSELYLQQQSSAKYLQNSSSSNWYELATTRATTTTSIAQETPQKVTAQGTSNLAERRVSDANINRLQIDLQQKLGGLEGRSGIIVGSPKRAPTSTSSPSQKGNEGSAIVGVNNSWLLFTNNVLATTTVTTVTNSSKMSAVNPANIESATSTTTTTAAGLINRSAVIATAEATNPTNRSAAVATTPAKKETKILLSTVTPFQMIKEIKNYPPNVSIAYDFFRCVVAACSESRAAVMEYLRNQRRDTTAAYPSSFQDYLSEYIMVKDHTGYKRPNIARLSMIGNLLLCGVPD